MAQGQSKMAEIHKNNKLVLYIEENNTEYDNVEMRCFIIYDYLTDDYVITGKRNDQLYSCNASEFNLTCRKTKNVIIFLQTLFNPKNAMNIVLYNFKNLTEAMSYFKFNVLLNFKNEKKEIVGYNDLDISSRSTMKYIKMMCNNLKHLISFTA